MACREARGVKSGGARKQERGGAVSMHWSLYQRMVNQTHSLRSSFLFFALFVSVYIYMNKSNTKRNAIITTEQVSMTHRDTHFRHHSSHSLTNHSPTHCQHHSIPYRCQLSLEGHGFIVSALLSLPRTRTAGQNRLAVLDILQRNVLDAALILLLPKPHPCRSSG